jgi:hypothetical protein
MNFQAFIRTLHNGTDGFFPFYWAIKGKNIVITNGKTGTNTLKYYSEQTSDEGFLTLHILLNLVYEKGFKIHILMREPNSRFKSGIFQEILLLKDNPKIKNNNVPDIDINITNIKKWNEDEWIINLEKFITDFIDIIISKNNKNNIKNKVETYFSNFHISNWLYIVKYLRLIFPDSKIKIWEYKHFDKLLAYLDCDIDDTKINTSENKPFVKEYLNAYSKLSENVRNKICMYVNDDVEIWNELIQMNNVYISIFDREPPPPPINNILDEIPNEKTDKTRRP